MWNDNLCFTVGLFVFLDHVLESETRFGVLEEPLQTVKRKKNLKRKRKTVLFFFLLPAEID